MVGTGQPVYHLMENYGENFVDAIGKNFFGQTKRFCVDLAPPDQKNSRGREIHLKIVRKQTSKTLLPAQSNGVCLCLALKKLFPSA